MYIMFKAKIVHKTLPSALVFANSVLRKIRLSSLALILTPRALR